MTQNGLYIYTKKEGKSNSIQAEYMPLLYYWMYAPSLSKHVVEFYSHVEFMCYKKNDAHISTV